MEANNIEYNIILTMGVRRVGQHTLSFKGIPPVMTTCIQIE